ncbi:MAG: hypothetical protein K2X47_08590 [Bdellovibrionales bacterium]|nr:hypothetical protein [Bdellovibrionales bacterium]
MILQDVIVHFQNFDPSYEIRNGINVLLQEIQDKSPDGATIKASFSQTSGAFLGAVSVASSVGNFCASATGNVLKEVTGTISEQMKYQIGKWKLRRFSENLKQLDYK